MKYLIFLPITLLSFGVAFGQDMAVDDDEDTNQMLTLDAGIANQVSSDNQ